ncbi:uncharacterized protein HKW66_Vig0125870 [Vigna angularis]|uniref:Uncharacterized protein n=1 Tax=Phaseolus angularis TaxID=3914 RepID=A0A8T0K5Z5_PHAAN|nr:uncharacterized protein HKW66_Vig0125870 [Vigna angularis]
MSVRHEGVFLSCARGEDVKGGLSQSPAMSLSTSGDAFGRPEGGAGSMGVSSVGVGSVGAIVLTEKEEGMTLVLPKEEERQLTSRIR